MRIELRELMDKLGVGYMMSAYETCPWSVYNGEQETTCSAEVRMNNDADEIEAELQMMRDVPAAGEHPVEQVFYLIAKPAVATQWDVTAVRIRGEGNKDELYAFEEKAVDFFNACVQELKMDKIPDIDALIAQYIKSSERYGGGARGGGNKSPKIKPQALLGMKTGR